MALRSMRQAISDAMHEEMRARTDVIMLGEALATRGGASQLTYGFLEEYGAQRVIETPISENALVSMALGAALGGLQVFAEVYSADFLFCAGSEVFNDIAKWRYQHQWDSPINLVLRMPMGSAGTASGPEHTQSMEAYLHHAPGLRVVVPGTPADAATSLREAINTGDPVIFLEHRALYDVQGEVPQLTTAARPTSTGRLVRPGTDVTVVAWGAMRAVAMRAATALAEDGVSAELVDPITVKPMNFELIAESVGKTGRLLVVDEGPRTGSVAAEIMARMLETGFAGIPMSRLTMPDIPHPFDPLLEAAVIPSAKDVQERAREMVRA